MEAPFCRQNDSAGRPNELRVSRASLLANFGNANMNMSVSSVGPSIPSELFAPQACRPLFCGTQVDRGMQWIGCVDEAENVDDDDGLRLAKKVAKKGEERRGGEGRPEFT